MFEDRVKVLPSPKTRTGRVCSFRTKAGRPCRAWAVRGSDPPACSSHLQASAKGEATGLARAGFCERAEELLRLLALDEEVPEAGFYRHTLSDEELADLVSYAAEESLEDEIACTRIAVRRTLELLNRGSETMSESEFLRAAGLVFRGARTIALLLREQRVLTGGEDSRLQEIFDAALDILSEEWGIEL